MPSLNDIFHNRNIILCLGSGGVGKTTISAALGVASAMSGRKTIVITIDPAKRLADALGISSTPGEINQINLQPAGINSFLDTLMMDPHSTFSNLLEKYADTPSRERIQSTRLYNIVNKALGSAQEHLALEKLYEINSSKVYDTIIIDTPPSRHALDFLIKPDFILEFLKGDAYKWMSNQVKEQNLFYKLVRTPMVAGFKFLAKITGQDIFEDIEIFFKSLSELTDGFSKRAKDLKMLLLSDDTAYFVIASARQSSLSEAEFLINTLHQNNFNFAGVIINQVIQSFSDKSDAEIKEFGKNMNEEFIGLIKKTTEFVQKEHNMQKKLNNNFFKRLTQTLQNKINYIKIQIPVYPQDINNLAGLKRIADYITSEL